jgi:hypothetical protein
LLRLTKNAATWNFNSQLAGGGGSADEAGGGGSTTKPLLDFFIGAHAEITG